MRSVLILSYAFPPAPAVGGRRIEAFCRHLPDFDWSPSVIAAASGSGLESGLGVWHGTDIHRTADLNAFAVLQRVWSGLRLGRAGSGAREVASDDGKRSSTGLKQTIMRALKTPDEQLLGWVPFAISAGLKAARKRPVDLILVSSPPHSAHLAGFALAKILKRPLVLDFRDPWTMNEYANKFWPTERLRNWNARMERKVLRAARYVIANTDMAAAMFRERYSWLNGKLTTIPNGFEPSRVRGVVPQNRTKFTITHAGSFYGDRNPRCFLKGLAQWLSAQDGSFRNTVHVLFIGRHDPAVRQMVSDLGLEQVVVFASPVSAAELYPKLAGSELLLLTLGFQAASKYVIPAKLYDYLAVGRPIMAFVPEGGEVSALLGRDGTHAVMTQDDPESVVKVLDSMYLQWCQDQFKQTSWTHNPGWPQFWWPNLTKRLADVLTESVSPPYVNAGTGDTRETEST
jgi:glycosyltransferase involved in cell wall biosynthesis